MGKLKLWFILLISGLVIFRLVYLDQDAPSYQLANICQEDEPYYCPGAINKVCAEEGRTVKGFEKTKMEGLDLYNRFAIYFSFKVFGNNFWGLRIPEVIASLIFILLLYSIFRSISPENNFKYFFLVLALTNFYLFTFSRYNNPQIFSILAITLTLWIVIKYGYDKPVPLILSGFFVAYTVFWVYLMNFFFLAGLGLFILVSAFRQKRISVLLYFLLGIMLNVILFVGCLRMVGMDIHNIFSAVSDYGAGKNSNLLTTTNSLSAVMTNIKGSIFGIMSTGFFRYQLIFLFLFLFSLPMLAINAFKKEQKKSDIALLLLFIIGFQIVQNYFALSYPFKKMLVDFPIISIAVYLVMTNFKMPILNNAFYKKILNLVWFLVAVLVCLFNFKINKSPVYWGYRGVGCYETTPFWFDGLNILSCVIPFIIMGIALFYKNRHSVHFMKAALLISIIGNMALGYKTFVRERKYQIRDCLVSLEPTLHNKVVITGFPFEWQFYTNCKPALHGYSINFGIRSIQSAADSMLINKKADFVMEKVMPDSVSRYAKDTNLNIVNTYKFSCYSYYLYKNRH